jgi:hypothetical protein
MIGKLLVLLSRAIGNRDAYETVASIRTPYVISRSDCNCGQKDRAQYEPEPHPSALEHAKTASPVRLLPAAGWLIAV